MGGEGCGFATARAPVARGGSAAACHRADACHRTDAQRQRDGNAMVIVTSSSIDTMRASS
jgi:hypothetical protein